MNLLRYDKKLNEYKNIENMPSWDEIMFPSNMVILEYNLDNCCQTALL